MAGADDETAKAFARLHGLIDRLPSAEELVLALESEAGVFPRKLRGRQAELLAQLFRLAAETAGRCGWTGKVVISGGRVLVDQDGALFPAEVSNRYFRTDGDPPGAAILDRLQALWIEPRTILDVGANIGELAIYFARRLPDCRVIAFEPAPENLEGFRANLALQAPPLGNLELVPEAVGDRTGKIAFSIGAGLLNTAMLEANRARLGAIEGVTEVEVPADTLEGHCARLGVDRIDLLKIDVEGGEPLLAESITGMKGRIGSAFVEVSTFNSLDAYGRLIDAFGQAGLAAAEKDLRRIEAPLDWLSSRLGESRALNLWFIDPARARPPRAGA